MSNYRPQNTDNQAEIWKSKFIEVESANSQLNQKI